MFVNNRYPQCVCIRFFSVAIDAREDKIVYNTTVHIYALEAVNINWLKEGHIDSYSERKGDKNDERNLCIEGRTLTVRSP